MLASSGILGALNPLAIFNLKFSLSVACAARPILPEILEKDFLNAVPFIALPSSKFFTSIFLVSYRIPPLMVIFLISFCRNHGIDLAYPVEISYIFVIGVIFVQIFVI